MKYCPHCKKPSARTVGLCPHCQQDLSGAPSLSAQTPRNTPVRTPVPTSCPPTRTTIRGTDSSETTLGASSTILAENGPPLGGAGVPSGMEMQTGYDYESYGMNAPPMIDPSQSGGPAGSSGLDLDSYAADPITSSPVAESLRKLDELSVGDVAKFRKPEPGPVGAMKYWWEVQKRLKVLKVEVLEAETKREKDLEDKIRQYAALGKRAKEAGVNTDELEALYTLALIAQGEFKGQKRKRASQSLEHKQKIDSLKAAIDFIEKKIAPIQQEEAQHKEEKQNLDQQRRSIETQLKRVQIDLRNMNTLIAQRKEAYTAEKATEEDKAKLAREIAQFESRLPPLLKQQEKHDLEMRHVSIPLDAVEQKLSEIRDVLAPEMQKVAALNNEIEAQKREFAADDEMVMHQLGEGARKVENLWNDVGEEVIRERINEPEIAEAKQRAHAAMAAAIESDRKYELLTLAIDSYDHNTVKRAKTIAFAAVGALALLIILLVIVL